MNDITRKEIKYLIDAACFEALNTEFAPHIIPDEFHFQKIHNLYFDNSTDEIICNSLQKPVFKQKLRLRAYEYRGELYSYSYIELKKKYKGIVYKRRMQIPLQQARNFVCCHDEYNNLGDSQIAKEIKFFINQTSCYPKLYLSYDRFSFKGKLDPTIRITFDTNILSRSTNLNFCCSAEDISLFGKKYYIMEIKANDAMPLWLTAILTKHKCYRVSFSKYGAVYQNNFLTSYKLEKLTA